MLEKSCNPTTAYETYADTAEADANTYTDTAIANLVDSTQLH